MKVVTKFFLGIATLFGCCSTSYPTVDERVVSDFNFSRYLGKWYEIARFDHSFERGLSHVVAEYSLREDGLIRVRNSGRKFSGLLKSATGKARLVNDGKSPEMGELEVSFFWNFYAPYNIIALGDEYEYALVSSGENYLWILSRTPTLGGDTLETLLDEAVARGFDTSRFIFVDHS